MNVPSKYATVDVRYGEKRRHLYAEDRESFEFHKERPLREREAYEAGVSGEENPHPDLVIWWLMGCQDSKK